MSDLRYALENDEPKRFISQFRMSRGMYHDLVLDLQDELKVAQPCVRPDPVYPWEAVAIALTNLGSPDNLLGKSIRCGRGEQTVRKHTDRVVDAIIKLWGPQSPNPAIRLPTAMELEKIMSKIEETRGLPMCMGGIDGKHFFHCAGTFSLTISSLCVRVCVCSPVLFTCPVHSP